MVSPFEERAKSKNQSPFEKRASEKSQISNSELADKLFLRQEELPNEPSTVGSALNSIFGTVGATAKGAAGSILNAGRSFLGATGEEALREQEEPESRPQAQKQEESVLGLPTIHGEMESLGPAKNALERIVRKGSEFGTASGPAAVPGFIVGAAIQGAVELGLNEETANALGVLLPFLPSVAKSFSSKIESGMKAGEALAAAEITPAELETAQKAVQVFEESIAPQAGDIEKSLVPSSEQLPISPFETAENVIAENTPKTKGEPLGLQVPKQPTESKSLKGRVTKESQLGESISPERFHSDAQAGREISHNIKENAYRDKQQVREAYRKAEEVTKTHNDIHPELAAENDARIEKFQDLTKRSAGQEATYQDTLALRDLVGSKDALFPVSSDLLMKQANSFSQKVNYELPYAGYKGEIKSIVKEMNNSVIKSLKKDGLDFEVVQLADKKFSQYADTYYGDEVSPYLQKKILDPESLYNKAAKNPGEYRAVKKAIGSRKSDLVNKLDREIVEKTLEKYNKDPSLIGSQEYNDTLSNLQQKIGKEKAAEVDHFLRKKEPVSRKSRETREKITKAEQERSKKVSSDKLKGIADKVAAHAKVKPEEVIKMLDSRSGIRELKKITSEKNFNTLTDIKVRDLLREGQIEATSTGNDLYKVLNKRSNFEILSEIAGEAEVEAARRLAKQVGEKELSQTNILYEASKDPEVYAKAGDIAFSLSHGNVFSASLKSYKLHKYIKSKKSSSS